MTPAESHLGPAGGGWHTCRATDMPHDWGHPVILTVSVAYICRLSHCRVRCPHLVNIAALVCKCESRRSSTPYHDTLDKTGRHPGSDATVELSREESQTSWLGLKSPMGPQSSRNYEISEVSVGCLTHLTGLWCAPTWAAGSPRYPSHRYLMQTAD